VFCLAAGASGNVLHDLDAAKAGNYAPLAARAVSNDADAGRSARALANYSLRYGSENDAYGWYAVAAKSKDRKIASEALSCQAGLLVRWGDKANAALRFKAAAERSDDLKDKSAYYYRVGKCYTSLAQASRPAQRIAYKKLADKFYALAGTDAAYVESLGHRYENILYMQTYPTDAVHILVSFTDTWEAWKIDAEAFVARCTDPEARATAQLMIMEVCFDELNSYDEALELGKSIDVKWRKQAAWSRIITGGIYQDRHQWKAAIDTYASIARDFPGPGVDFDRNDVKALAGRLITICKRMEVQK